ncbi:hypothetical protein [Planomonospora venezuelensis]|uniref:Uncharacterized protein n=1 Tax=Planomonospora venezuelensis TaxID=1999 RepID=A0A841D8Q7_PLAVE|nr:hypothetical protein [Planomonospora venezuelensis]MBB5963796.1 hypothetical protein [Planomonospora venezuelensis]GIM99582.1 hypothetical protein Pve01_12410 [Planomonospora venezuelensis]
MRPALPLPSSCGSVARAALAAAAAAVALCAAASPAAASPAAAAPRVPDPDRSSPVSAASSQARPAGSNAATALKRQFVTGRGVKMTEVMTMTYPDDPQGPPTKSVTTGAYRFGRSGVTAYDLTWTMKPDLLDMRTRIISLPKATYVAGKIFSLPEGKTWMRMSPGPSFNFTSQPINALEPSTLKHLIATAKTTRDGQRVGGARTTVRSGVITVAQLYAASPSFRKQLGERPRGIGAKLKLRWKLWLDGDQLTRRLTSSYTETTQNLTYSSQMTVTTKTEFSHWGGKVTVTAPPAASVIDSEDVESQDAMTALPGARLPVPGRSR